MELLIGFALLSGVMTVLSPCILPILPIVLGSSAGGRARPLGVVVGLVVSFTLLTLLLARLLAAVGLPAGALRGVAVVLLLAMGGLLVTPALAARVEGALGRLLPGGGIGRRHGWWGGLVTGLSLGAIWTPCAGPILASVVVLTALEQLSAASAAIVGAYAAGAALPLLLVTYGGRALIQRIPLLASRPLRLQQGFGVLTIGVALLVAAGLDQPLTLRAAGFLPDDWGTRLTAFEQAPEVLSALDRLESGPVALVEPPAAAAAAAPTTVPSPLPPTASAPAAATAAATLPPVPAPTATEVLPYTMRILEPRGPAPELTGIVNWLNSEPLTLESLRGQVVLIDFWTLGCINCQRTLPYVTAWYDRYVEQGLVVIGVHTPEFQYEHETASVAEAIDRFGIHYPVAQDNDFRTWRAYRNRYWPAKYFIDAEGQIRHVKIGEGSYEESEEILQLLLDEARRAAGGAGG